MNAQTLASINDLVTIVLYIVALIVTVIGFVASLKFYRDGVKLQGLANDALTRIEERAQTIQTQVGGMFDKTLDAAIGRREELESSFEEINKQLEKAATEIVSSAQKKIGAAGEDERKRLAAVVEKQMQLLRVRVEETRESAAEIAERPINVFPRSALQSRILSYLLASTKPLSRPEITEAVKMSDAAAGVSLMRLLQAGLVKRAKVDDKWMYSPTVAGLSAKPE